METKSNVLVEQLRHIGSLGGNANTEEQKRARKRNMLIALAKRHPNSVKIKQRLEELK